ncbi:9834_t:CDS:2, partial [Funneliformis geosporum]
MISDISEPGFKYFLNTPCQTWDAVRYHESWEDNNLGLDKATLTRSFHKQLEIIKSQGTEEEKENAIRLENQFKPPTFVSVFRLSNTTATHGTASSHGYGLRLRCWLQLTMELRLRMVMDCVSAAESTKTGLIDNFWMKRRNFMEHENMKVNSTFLSCNGIQIGCFGNNVQKHKRSYENLEPSGVEIPTKGDNVNVPKRKKNIDDYFPRNVTQETVNNDDELSGVTLVNIPKIPDQYYKDGYTTLSPRSPALNNSLAEPPMLVDSINNPFLEKDEVDDDILIIDDIDDLCFMDGNPADGYKIEETNVSHLFRKYQNNSINIAKTEGLFIESNVHEILSLSSIFLLIPDSHSRKMIDIFGSPLLDEIHQQIIPTQQTALDSECEAKFRDAIKRVTKESFSHATDWLMTELSNNKPLKDNMGFVILDCIRSLPFTKIKNDPSEMTL